MSDKILIVDDNNEFRRELKEALDPYDVVEASNGHEALKLLSRPNEIGLVILDIKMPGISGTDILKIVKKRMSGIGVIMLTAFSSKETAVESLRGKADEYFEKPFELAKLKESIEKILERKKNGNETSSSEINQKISRIKRFIENNYTKKIGLKEASELVGFSSKYLSRVFKMTAGIGFKKYELKVKIKKAKEFLRKTGNTIGQVSDKLGFANPESFMRIFKKHTGKTPSFFRTKKRRKNAAGQDA